MVIDGHASCGRPLSGLPNADAEMVRTLRLAGTEVMMRWRRRCGTRRRPLPQVTPTSSRSPAASATATPEVRGAIAKVGGIMKAVADHAARGGYVPGLQRFRSLPSVAFLPGALTRNLHLRFECRDIFGARGRKVATDGPGAKSVLPSAEGHPCCACRSRTAGRYQASRCWLRGDVLARLEGEGPHIAAASPLLAANRLSRGEWRRDRAANPNGSLDNIAGIYGGPKNVLGLMPHPERMSEACLGRTGGLELFQAVVRAA